MGFLDIFKSYTKNPLKDSLKVLEADIYHANTMASESPFNGTCMQIRISYSPAATFFLFLAQWTDCSLAEALGLLSISIYKVYLDGTSSMFASEKKASIKQFYSFIFPTLMQLRRKITGMETMEDQNKKKMFLERYMRTDDDDQMHLSVSDAEREEECGICMLQNSKFVLPTCNHCLCLSCFNECKAKSEWCPFCRSSLLEVVADELWVFIERRDIADLTTVFEEDHRRLSMYLDRLPLIS
ncbi:E3 ubiquitin-protein ligase AIRP2 isoform X2 [Dendrobium catenatum]|uniref:RING-type domain-containing protein n=1 Tax=Dendrobium catenatum TaxID=906689 RepID=A0A2I0W0W7_9ASPA|nr:E3 ubiquitin-protein ligase AIRP2 isoform X2 [Dendrobium catenatum]PKU69301.1 hypothetical protein MA16_Dca002571 [Dendrobium catenatum]